MTLADRSSHASRHDRALAGLFEAREADWRCGAVVYQVLVDRFVPSADLAAKRHLYAAPKRLRRWSETPVKGRYLPTEKLWSHEIEFWGGDLKSLASRLDAVQQLGTEVLYLNPICEAYTNHKYDALDYRGVSPEYGSRADVRALADALHGRGMKLVLDGVFNHMGRHSPLFAQAQRDREAARAAGTLGQPAPAGDRRDWFCFDDAAPGGVNCWWRAQNLPELKLENPAVRADLWGDPDSVVRGWLRDGADGWRLDVAFDIGPSYLQELTDAAHAEKPGSWVIGEIPNYPAQWFPSVDGVLMFSLRQLILKLADGALSPATVMAMWQRLLADSDYEHILRSWVYLDNHDTPRLAHALPDARARALARVLQFTLPGSPNLYYGTEVDMEGGDDPEMRAPMRWDRVEAGHPALDQTRRLAALRRERRALRVGQFRSLESRTLFAFERYTDRAADAVLVIANPAPLSVTETLLVPDSKMMDATPLVDQTGLFTAPLRLWCGLLTLTLPPRSAVVLTPEVAPIEGYTNYKRVQ